MFPYNLHTLERKECLKENVRVSIGSVLVYDASCSILANTHLMHIIIKTSYSNINTPFISARKIPACFHYFAWEIY